MPVPRELQCGITNHPTSYAFRVKYGHCAELQTPNLGDLLDEVKSDHDGRCGCGIDVSSRVWTTSYKFDGKRDTVGLDTSAFTVRTLDTSLESLWGLACDPESWDDFHVFFEGTGRVRKRDLEFFSHGHGIVYQFPEGTVCLHSLRSEIVVLTGRGPSSRVNTTQATRFFARPLGCSL